MGDLKLYSTKEVAEILGLNTDYVRQLARAKKIESIKLGNLVKFKEIHIKDYIEKGGRDE